MTELATYRRDLPAQPTDLAKFIVVAQEKLKAVKAEIRAIQRLDMAKEVYDQKIEEQARLQELTLLAYQRMGEITREMPKASGGDRRSEDFKSSAKETFEKPKSQAIHELGFSKPQVSRMEQMAAHPDIVEEVIAESQAGQTEATQTEVLRRIKENKVIDLTQAREERCAADMQKIDCDCANLKLFQKATSTSCLELLKITDEVLDSVVDMGVDLQDVVNSLGSTIRLLTDIQRKLLAKGGKHGKTAYNKGN